jgi:hypothetical protein
LIAQQRHRERFRAAVHSLSGQRFAQVARNQVRRHRFLQHRFLDPTAIESVTAVIERSS